MKRLLKAILWITCYGGACWFGIKAKLGFDILSQTHWKLLFDKSVHAVWPSEMADKKLVCKVLLAFIIIGALGLAVVTKKKKKRIPVVKGEIPQKEGFRPSPMASQGKMAPPAPPPPASSAVGNAPVQNIAPTAPAVNLMSDTVRKITDIAKNFEASVFPHVKLENTFTQLVVSDDSTALLLKILPQTGTWQLTPSDLPGESLWLLDGVEQKNILKEIMESTATLARLEPEAHAISVIVLNGTLQNPLEIKEYLKNNGIRIASLDTDIPDIPKWQELLAEFYLPKEKGQENEATNNS